jgi:hypothetical protein
VCCMMSLAVIESNADFNSAGTELVTAPVFVFTLVVVVVHASAKLSTAANETIAWIRFFIRIALDSVVGFVRCFLSQRWAQVKLAWVNLRAKPRSHI